MNKVGNLSEKSFGEGTTMKNVALKRVSAGLLGVCTLCILALGCSDTKSERLGCLAPITELSFDESMGKSESDFRFIFVNSDDTARYAKTKALYEKNLPSKVASGQNPRIPKIIHQIWLGPNLPPRILLNSKRKSKLFTQTGNIIYGTKQSSKSSSLKTGISSRDLRTGQRKQMSSDVICSIASAVSIWT